MHNPMHGTFTSIMLKSLQATLEGSKTHYCINPIDSLKDSDFVFEFL